MISLSGDLCVLGPRTLFACTRIICAVHWPMTTQLHRCTATGSVDLTSIRRQCARECCTTRCRRASRACRKYRVPCATCASRCIVHATPCVCVCFVGCLRVLSVLTWVLVMTMFVGRTLTDITRRACVRAWESHDSTIVLYATTFRHNICAYVTDAFLIRTIVCIIFRMTNYVLSSSSAASARPTDSCN